ncbi:Sodium channel protein type 10 subunit alpha (Peripheral nerve sodium channel 3) (PN3) (Sensory neuron sodium channel) (Sodium channel protein type X subunit alpha) (Voltage-gated sodium channel subunit alpha Nav1.8), partial [Durusdinium trenchii]
LTTARKPVALGSILSKPYRATLASVGFEGAFVVMEDLLDAMDLEKQRIQQMADDNHSALDHCIQEAFGRILEMQRSFYFEGDVPVPKSVEMVESSQQVVDLAATKLPRKPKLVELVDPVPGVDETWIRQTTPDLMPRYGMEESLNVATVTADVSDLRPKEASAMQAIPSEGNLTSQRSASERRMGSKLRSRTLDRFLSEKTGRELDVKSLLDYGAGVLVMLNSVIMLVELELEGQELARLVGLAEHNYSNALTICRVINDGFSLVFFAELLLRIFLEPRTFHRDVSNWLDAFLAIAGLVDFFITISLPETSTSQSIVLLRLMRVMKSLRAIRMVRSLRIFRGLRLLVKACQCFLPSLCWAMVLLGLLMSMGSLLIGNLLQDFIADDSGDDDHRLWLWEHYGTAYRATWTLFRVTFAGNWPHFCDPVVELSEVFSLFFFLYITIVVFAVLRVITAIFLKDTLDAAQNDAEQLVMDRMALKSKLINRLEGVFKVMDHEGTGIITEERLSQILANPKVAAYFATLELDISEGRALFHLLDNGNGEVTQDEFISGILRCKGQARAIEQVAMHSKTFQKSYNL